MVAVGVPCPNKECFAFFMGLPTFDDVGMRFVCLRDDIETSQGEFNALRGHCKRIFDDAHQFALEFTSRSANDIPIAVLNKFQEFIADKAHGASAETFAYHAREYLWSKWSAHLEDQQLSGMMPVFSALSDNDPVASLSLADHSTDVVPVTAEERGCFFLEHIARFWPTGCTGDLQVGEKRVSVFYVAFAPCLCRAFRSLDAVVPDLIDQAKVAITLQKYIATASALMELVEKHVGLLGPVVHCKTAVREMRQLAIESAVATSDRSKEELKKVADEAMELLTTDALASLLAHADRKEWKDHYDAAVSNLHFRKFVEVYQSMKTSAQQQQDVCGILQSEIDEIAGVEARYRRRNTIGISMSLEYQPVESNNHALR